MARKQDTEDINKGKPIDSLRNFVELLCRDEVRGKRFWFRGVPKSYELIPGVFREDAVSFAHERTAFSLFQSECWPDGINKDNNFDWLCHMQHYRLPTRLLDWTTNALVALYFAVDDESHFDEDGEVFFLRPSLLTKLVTGFDGVMTPTNYRISLYSLLPICDSYQELLNALSDPRNAAMFHPEHLDLLQRYPDFLAYEITFPIAVSPKKINTRMHLQHSVFTMDGGIRSSESGAGGPMHLMDFNASFSEKKNPFRCVEFLMDGKIK